MPSPWSSSDSETLSLTLTPCREAHAWFSWWSAGASTVGRVEPTAAATELGSRAGLAHASTIRARSTYLTRIDLERDRDLNVERTTHNH